MRIDHVLYAVRDLEAGAARVAARLGLPLVGGGLHQGLGTENRIVPLGGGYLEVIAVVNRGAAAGSELGRLVQERIDGTGDGLFAWAVGVDDAAAVAARLGSPVTTIVRDGLSARVTGLAEALRDPSLPFFISRDEGIVDPGAAGDAGGIAWIEVAGDADVLARHLDGAELPVRVVSGTPGVRAVGIGDRELRAN